VAHPTVALFSNGASHQQHWCRAFQEGLRRHGIRADIHAPLDRVDCDLAVFWGHRHADVIRRQQGKDYLVMEQGYLGERLKNISLGFNGLNGQATFYNGSPRRADKWRHLLKPWHTGEYYLVVGQVNGDASLQGRDINDWLAEVAGQTKGLPVMFRPHPLGRGYARYFDEHTGTLAEALAGAKAIISYSSTAGVDAILSGTPTYAAHKCSMVWDVAQHDISLPPIQPDRTVWLERMSWCQWTENEIIKGEAWEHLQSLLSQRLSR
jgi:hypothetical protein